MREHAQMRHCLTEEHRGRPLTLEAAFQGDGWLVTLSGGERPHWGGCALSEPYENRRGRTDASVSVLERPGHRDGALAGKLAYRLARELGCSVWLLCGIHYDELSEDELSALLAVCDRLCGRLLDEVKRCGSL